MSAPVVSGAVALLLQDEPRLNPDQVKYRLMATASQSWNYSADQAGAGYLDVYAAVTGSTDRYANQGITAQPDARQWRRWHRFCQRGLELGRLEQRRVEFGWLELGRLEFGWLE